jgi:hypothetical protein
MGFWLVAGVYSALARLFILLIYCDVSSLIEREVDLSK